MSVRREAFLLSQPGGGERDVVSIMTREIQKPATRRKNVFHDDFGGKSQKRGVERGEFLRGFFGR